MEEESLLEEMGENLLEETHGMANVTVRADADCFLLCDGEYLDIQLEVGKMTQKQLPVGRHILEFIYTEDANIKVEKEVDLTEAGKSYLVLVQDLKAAINAVVEEAKAKEEAKRKAEEEARRKDEEEVKRQALMQMDFVQEYLAPSEFNFKNNFIDNEIKKAIDEEIRPAADLGNASAQFVLGKCYDLGLGVSRDPADAVKWFRKAAEQGLGLVIAQNVLGWMYQNGRGVIKDDAEAAKWFRKAAEQGYAKAQFKLGWMYQSGEGVLQDDAEAVKWYRKAAEQGLAGAQNNLGAMYELGRGVQQDYAEAAKWLRKAAEQGVDGAQINLGLMYEKGRGVAKDDAEAVKWYRKAAEQGHETAKQALKRLGF